MSLSIETRVITWQAALQACQAAIASAEAQGRHINVAVTDRAGLLMCFLRMPSAFPQSISIAQEKARTAAGFGFPTAQWMDGIGHSESMKLGFANQPGLIIFGGGLPIYDQGVLVGGIGVSGASEDEDQRCAQAGLDAIGAAVSANDHN
ncbi:heme-binding protein [Castellaniella sp.]|uniref:GlcG/HbpS family heme-binding protein n=1 Tax=Castellaniella sp. TaxID=1955812 RepID=UPI002AFE3CDC|nr:heme-binding protein [Castellaniella sp.]